jgi:hypothetical protein
MAEKLKAFGFPVEAKGQEKEVMAGQYFIPNVN